MSAYVVRSLTLHWKLNVKVDLCGYVLKGVTE